MRSFVGGHLPYRGSSVQSYLAAGCPEEVIRAPESHPPNTRPGYITLHGRPLFGSAAAFDQLAGAKLLQMRPESPGLAGDSYSKVETCDGIKFRLACRGHNDFLDFAYEAPRQLLLRAQRFFFRCP
ncbi:unnamed protein product [Symbiodinium natans]|uniref:Uncharacterized protein n=1 Tax=Symbiodinium natans TaxID=878477 RepID=A0A812TCS1_9DINO|nr:unnamed protein product [Symbiodinium natans]